MFLFLKLSRLIQMLHFLTINAERRVKRKLAHLAGVIEKGLAWRAPKKFYLRVRHRELEVLRLGRVRMMRNRLRRMGWGLNFGATSFE